MTSPVAQQTTPPANPGGAAQTQAQDRAQGQPTPTVPLPSVCLASQFGSSLIKVPVPNTENDDHNPPRIASRNLFDVALGDDNLFKGDRYKRSLTLTALNVTNRKALYDFLSRFSGTHYVSPRSLTAEVGLHF